MPAMEVIRNLIKNVITDDNDYEEPVRLAAFVAVIGIALLILAIITVAIIGVCLKVAEAASIITALGVAIGTIATVVLYAAVKAIGEKKNPPTNPQG